jgi:hypothetical protein
MPSALIKNSLLNVLPTSSLSFHHFGLDALTLLKANPKLKIRYHKLMLRHDLLSRYHLTIGANMHILSSHEDKIDLTTILTTAEDY